MNGLDVPVKVTVSGQPPFQLDPGARKSFSVRQGACAVAAETLDGQRRETDQVEVPRSGDAVYSVAGAAPLYVVTAFYSRNHDAEGRSGHENLCGLRTFARDVNYFFAEPPDSVTTSDSETSVVRSALLQGTDGWKGCVLSLQAEGKDRAAADMLAAVRAMDPSERPVFAEARLRWVLGEDAKAMALFRSVAAASDSLDAHFAYVRFGLALGQRESLRREYERPNDRLKDVQRRCLAARLLPAAEGVKELRALVDEHPQDDEPRLGLVWALNGAGRYAEALAALEPFGDGARLPADDRVRWLRRRVWALAALGRSEEAVQTIRAEPKGKEPASLYFLQIQGQLAARLGRSDLEPDPKDLESPREQYEQEWRQVTYDGLVHPERLDRERIDGLKYVRTLAPVLVKAAVDPRPALASLHRLRSYDAELLPESLSMVLWAEACRVGDSAAEALLRHSLLTETVDFSALCAYVREGRPAVELNEAWEDRGAIHLARSRALRARGDAAGAAAEEALVRKYDVYRGPATRALESWPSTTPGARPPAAGDVRLAAAQVDAPARGPRGGTKPVPPPPPEHKLVRVEGLRLEPEP